MPFDADLNADLVKRLIQKEMVREQIVYRDGDGLYWMDDDGREYLVELRVFPLAKEYTSTRLMERSNN